MRTTFVGLVAAVAALQASTASAQVFINEIFFNPGGGSTDVRDEFVEIRGSAGASLANHFLLIVENERDSVGVGGAGEVDNIFNLGAFNLGSNGFLSLRQKFNRYAASQLVSGGTNLVNEGPNKPGTGPGAFPGFGNTAGEGSTIGASDLDQGVDAPTTGAIENSGFTAMLIRNDSGAAPLLGEDLDLGNDGLDVPTGRAGWTILDSVGVLAEVDETENGRLYGRVNFGVNDTVFGFPPGWQPNVEPGAAFALVDYEVEYIGRWGNSTGFGTGDWHVSNLTDNAGSGSSGVGGNVGPHDLRQSGDPHPTNDNNPNTPAPQPALVETNRGVRYGTPLLRTIGGPNFITGDYTGDGVVNAADYTAWRDTIGATGSETAEASADGNRDFVVNQADYNVWVASYGTPGAGPSTSTAVPEPAAALLLVLGAVGAPRRR
jgi:hypothetical protein